MNKRKTTDSSKTSAPRSTLGRVKISYPRLQRILVPLDFSGRSRQALRYAIPFAQKFSARLVLFHALEPMPVWTPDLAIANANVHEATKAVLRRLSTMASTLLPAGLHERNVVRHGRPAAEIVAAIRQYDIDLVVMSTGGASGLKRLLLGGTTEHVVRHAGCPVLTVRRK